jgi:hypothetical protein
VSGVGSTEPPRSGGAGFAGAGAGFSGVGSTEPPRSGGAGFAGAGAGASDETTTEQPDETAGKKKSKKKAAKQAAQVSGANTVALASHPRALAAIARLRSRGALGAAAFVAVLSYTAGVPIDDCILRGLVAGIVGYYVGWYVGVTFWRQLIRAELRAAVQRRAAAASSEGDA